MEKTTSKKNIIQRGALGAMAVGLVASPILASDMNQPAHASEANITAEQQQQDIQKIFNDINDYRESLGLNRLKYSSTVSTIAQKEAQRAATSGDINHSMNFLSDTSAGSWKSAGEITALSGKTDAHRFFKQWKNSPAHNDLMKRADFDVMGIGVYPVFTDGYLHYVATVDFYGYGSNMPGVSYSDAPGTSSNTSNTVETPETKENNAPTTNDTKENVIPVVDEPTVNVDEVKKDNESKPTQTPTSNTQTKTPVGSTTESQPQPSAKPSQQPTVDNEKSTSNTEETKPTQQATNSPDKTPAQNTVNSESKVDSPKQNAKVDDSNTVTKQEESKPTVTPTTPVDNTKESSNKPSTTVTENDDAKQDSTVAQDNTQKTAQDVAREKSEKFIPDAQDKRFLTNEKLEAIKSNPNVYAEQSRDKALSTPQKFGSDRISVDNGGAIDEFFQYDGGINKYGTAVGDLKTNLIHGGSVQAFSNNISIFKTENTGAHAVDWKTTIGSYFSSHGGENVLGYPTGNEVVRPTAGNYQKFRNPETGVEKTVFSSEGTGTFTVDHSTRVGQAWQKYGGQYAVGLPTSEVQTRADGTEYQTFKTTTGVSHMIMGNNETGFFILNQSSPIGQAWLNAGGEYNWGNAITNAYMASDGSTHQKFSHGIEVKYTPETGVTVVS